MLWASLTLVFSVPSFFRNEKASCANVTSTNGKKWRGIWSKSASMGTILWNLFGTSLVLGDAAARRGEAEGGLTRLPCGWVPGNLGARGQVKGYGQLCFS